MGCVCVKRPAGGSFFKQEKKEKFLTNDDYAACVFPPFRLFTFSFYLIAFFFLIFNPPGIVFLALPWKRQRV
jgi:hypothetical protein